MGKAMSIAGMIVGGAMALIFALDAFLGIPFGGREGMMLPDIGLAICGAILAYLGWNAFRDSP
ncbi:MAG: hypothetical protein WD738_09470 [Pirellulales bacterium]